MSLLLGCALDSLPVADIIAHQCLRGLEATPRTPERWDVFQWRLKGNSLAELQVVQQIMKRYLAYNGFVVDSLEPDSGARKVEIHKFGRIWSILEA